MRVTFNKLGDSVNWGRMANQMWQLAHVVGYSKRSGLDWYIPKWKYSQYFIGPFNEEEIPKDQHFYKEKEKDFAYNYISTFGYTPHDITLVGYWQSEKYFKHCEQTIRNIFTFKPDIVQEVRTFIDHHRNGKIPIFVHFRRTDYVQGMAHYYCELTMDWYQTAMSRFNDETHHFFCLSDDISYVKQNLHKRGNVTFSHFDEVLDLCLMSECSNGIMANSSFSFWGGYLIKNPDKRIIAPAKDKWFKPIAGHNVDDLYNEKWELL